MNRDSLYTNHIKSWIHATKRLLDASIAGRTQTPRMARTLWLPLRAHRPIANGSQEAIANYRRGACPLRPFAMPFPICWRARASPICWMGLRATLLCNAFAVDHSLRASMAQVYRYTLQPVLRKHAPRTKRARVQFAMRANCKKNHAPCARCWHPFLAQHRRKGNHCWRTASIDARVSMALQPQRGALMYIFDFLYARERAWGKRTE